MGFVHLLEQGITWSVGVWDQDLLFDFYRGAGEFCEKLAENEETVSLGQPDSFPLYQKDGIYPCLDLARWFREQAEAIAQRFDRRNGSDYYGRKLRPANICQ